MQTTTMICKCLLFSSVVLLCTIESEGYKGTSYVNRHMYSLPLGTHAVATRNGKPGEHDYHSPAKYSYEYGVSDQHTGDKKKQFEERDGDKVRGYYSFQDADGSIRTVRYTVDKDSGFKAVVERTGHNEVEN